MANQPTPNAVANTVVRYLLTKAGIAAGGLSKDQWQQTLQAFDNCCAYTGQPLPAAAEKEHAVPMNRFHGGLHVFGNVVPATADANRQKGGLRFDEFMRAKGEKFSSLAHLTDEQREEKIARIGQFMQAARPDGLLAAHPELLAFYQRQYNLAKALCASAADELHSLLQTLHVADEPGAATTESAALDLPSTAQFELEESNAEELPAAYRLLQEQGSQTGVGAYAQAVFRQLFADGRVASFLPDLTNPEASLQSFKLSYPVLTTRRTEQPDRYYAAPYQYAGTDYYLCNDWRERQRDFLDAWLVNVLAGHNG